MSQSAPLNSDSARPMPRKALILGPKGGVVDRIARQLTLEGIEPMVPGLTDDQLPSLSDPNAAAKLKEIFQKFALEARQGNSQLSLDLHPGLSAWSERPELPTLGSQCGFRVISPSPRVLSLFGNKLNLFQKAEEVGIPNLVIDPEPMHSQREIEKFIHSRKQKFPFILKTAKGGSRFGLTAIHEATELEAKLPLWLEQLRRYCGEVILFAERYLEGSRLVSVPFARFVDGRSRTFPIVDASLQCRHRKVMEFCPAQSVDAAIEKQITDWTLQLADLCGYVGVGTLEYLVDSDRAYLIGGTPRLNAAFHLWEQVAGTHAVSWQLAAMQGGRATPPPVVQPDKKWSSGLALRLYAEDSILQLPQPGIAHEVVIQRHWDFAIGEAELDLVLEAGDEIRSEQQGWIGTLWIGAQDRSQALRIARGVLDEMWIAGSLQTNERFLSELLVHPWVSEGVFHTGFIDEEFLPALRPPVEFTRLFASVLESVSEGKPGHRWAVGDQWVKSDPSLVHWVAEPLKWVLSKGIPLKAPPSDGRTSGELELRGVSGTLRIADGRTLKLCAYPLSENKWQVRLGSWVMMTRLAPGKAAQKPRPRISSLIPGRVHSILFREGASVQAHEPLLIIESLGMLVPHALPVDVRIDRWKVLPEQRVHAGQELAEFEVLAKS